MAALKSFEAARRSAGVLNRLPPRVRSIEVQQIVGSVDEVKRQTLRANFRPRARYGNTDRYRSVLAAMEQDRPLPAIEVYSVGGEHYVLDGHHRVAAARSMGYVFIDALVHEFPSPTGNGGGCRCNAIKLPATWVRQTPTAPTSRRLPRYLSWAAGALAPWLPEAMVAHRQQLGC
jgi:hypothetical protein